ncbi:hypothetical protein DFR29_101388 [Tahibacter aquaticus]|uniref:Uncharacterized protein n=1 Tax=Tahibacter aquaticus TaxID=520092 RepID=A0A4R6ZAI1_9GAMM|nr:hypothetical protein [Tahibacter aquaticus]TDR48764.1 hypothetical protein DFR29_101388 [Tahibacter aquaticus]
MSNNLQYQYTFDATPGAAASVRPDPNAPVYASEDALVASLSNSECVFQVKRTGEAHVMTFQVLQALDQCREFRTLDEHVARIQSTIPGLENQREAVGRVLQSLIERDLLISDTRFSERLVTDTAAAPAPLRAIFVRACDRPAQLERLLASISEYERRHRAGRHYVVLDDSALAPSIDRHRDLLREFARTTGCKVTYVGPAERQRLVERFAKAVPGVQSALSSLLLPQAGATRFGGGRSWNLALLLSAGGRFTLFDDDQRLPLRRHELARNGLDLSPTQLPFARFYRNMEEALAAGDEIPDDPFALHLDVCGAGIGELVRRPEFGLNRESLRGLNLARLAHLDSNTRVLLTQQGTYGSARSESAAWIYHLDAAGRADLCSSRDAYLSNVEAQFLWQGTQRARLAPISWFTPFAFDNSELLPCTNAVGRGEDALFSAATHFCHPEALALELPVAVGHVQEQSRRRTQRTMLPNTPRVNHFATDFIQRQFGSFVASDPGQRLGLLAEIFRDLAGAGETARSTHLREYLNYVRADSIERLQQQFEAATDAPVFWQADVRSIIDANGRALIAKAPPRLGDWNDDYDSSACAAALRQELNQLAENYDAWPRLWQHARELGDKTLAGV